MVCRTRNRKITLRGLIVFSNFHSLISSSVSVSTICLLYPPFSSFCPLHPPFITSQNPQTAIPKGTFLAIAITTVVYLVMAWAVGFVVLRNAPGEAQDFFGDLLNTTNQCLNGSTVALNFTMDETACGVEPYNFSAHFPACSLSCGCDYCTTVECIYRDSNRSDLALLCSQGFANLTQRMCAYGLLNNFQVLTNTQGLCTILTCHPVLYTHLLVCIKSAQQ